jgi:hypothetical protein
LPEASTSIEALLLKFKSSLVFVIFASGIVGTVIVAEFGSYGVLPMTTRKLLIRSPLNLELPATHQVQVAQLTPVALPE